MDGRDVTMAVNPRYVRYVFPAKKGGTWISFEGDTELEVEFEVADRFDSVMRKLRRAEAHAS